MPIGGGAGGRGGTGSAHMTLEMECWPDELSDAQLAAYQLAESEHRRIRTKLMAIVGDAAENLFLGELFSAYELKGAPAADLQEISKPLAGMRKEVTGAGSGAAAFGSRTPVRTLKRTAAAANEAYADDYDDGESGDASYSPAGAQKRATGKLAKLAAEKKQRVEAERAAERAAEASSALRSTSPRGKGAALVAEATGGGGTAGGQQQQQLRPSENTSIGGLSVGDPSRTRKDVVDLTKDEPTSPSSVTAAALAARGGADSREVVFNKLQGKTFPSLVVVARPSLRVKDAPNDRPTLDAKVKSVLMHTATKFSEWLIQQGLVRSEQNCQVHAGKVLKLGMYSDASKFAYSGGYLWISECCPARYVSVFNGSLFEGAPHAPSVLLKLIYHWSCQTNVQNVVQWVKVDNLYVKGLFTLLRAVCTVALHQHGGLLGGPGKRVEVGVISLGTTSQDGQQRQVKVEVLGVLDHDGKVVRLRAVEPLTDGERNYKKRFAKILEPLNGWVHRDSIIQTDLTVDKGTLNTMGFRNVHQTEVSTGDAKMKGCNANIMDYLRRIVPRMFQNTLSLLSRQIIQQFLDELVWREWYGTSPAVAFDNIVRHIAEQTRLEAKEPLVGRLARVAQNPFRNWAHLSVKTPAKALRENFFSGISASAAPVSSSPTGGFTPGKRGRKRREISPEPEPAPATPPPTQGRKSNTSLLIREDVRTSAAQRKADAAAAAQKAAQKAAAAAAAAKAAADAKNVHLESYYYAMINTSAEPNDSGLPVPSAVGFRAQCPQCHETAHSNTALMDHLKRHANSSAAAAQSADSGAGSELTPVDWLQCRYCLWCVQSEQQMDTHLATAHPQKTRQEGRTGFSCLICEIRLPNLAQLVAHMQKTHVTFDVPYRCGCCAYGSSSLRCTVDHFYEEHATSAALQCPFCMQIYVVQDSLGAVLPANIAAYLEHLQDHTRLGSGESASAAAGGGAAAKRGYNCNKCALTFLDRGGSRMHQAHAHVSQVRGATAVPMLRSATKIAKPKYRYNYVQSGVQLVARYESLTMCVENGQLCLECDADFEEKAHFPGLMKCPRCPYHSSCQRAMITHTSRCSYTSDGPTGSGGSGADDPASNELAQEHHCICGFASAKGNALARHLLACGRRSAYTSSEAVAENTVKRNVLDMLGLMRRDDDATGDGDEGSAAGDESAAGGGRKTPAGEEAVEVAGAADEAMPEAEAGADSVDEAAAPMEHDGDQSTSSSGPIADLAGPGLDETGETAMLDADAVGLETPSAPVHQFNTDLSLDDLAAPASVAPPASGNAEPVDRTPQLSDEYQSLATPRIAQPVEHPSGGGGDAM